MSSPSQPSSSQTGTSRAARSSLTMGNCSCSAGSIGGRWALYCGSISMRTRGLPRSKAQMTPSGLKVPTIFMNMLKKPNSALVARPSGADMGWRMAWNARCMSELPSMTAMTRRWLGAAVAWVGSGMRSPNRSSAPIVPGRRDGKAAGLRRGGALLAGASCRVGGRAKKPQVPAVARAGALRKCRFQPLARGWNLALLSKLPLERAGTRDF